MRLQWFDIPSFSNGGAYLPAQWLIESTPQQVVPPSGIVEKEASSFSLFLSSWFFHGIRCSYQTPFIKHGGLFTPFGVRSDIWKLGEKPSHGSTLPQEVGSGKGMEEHLDSKPPHGNPSDKAAEEGKNSGTTTPWVAPLPPPPLVKSRFSIFFAEFFIPFFHPSLETNVEDEKGPRGAHRVEVHVVEETVRARLARRWECMEGPEVGVPGTPPLERGKLQPHCGNAFYSPSPSSTTTEPRGGGGGTHSSTTTTAGGGGGGASSPASLLSLLPCPKRTCVFIPVACELCASMVRPTSPMAALLRSHQVFLVAVWVEIRDVWSATDDVVEEGSIAAKSSRGDTIPQEEERDHPVPSTTAASSFPSPYRRRTFPGRPVRVEREYENPTQQQQVKGWLTNVVHRNASVYYSTPTSPDLLSMTSNTSSGASMEAKGMPQKEEWEHLLSTVGKGREPERLGNSFLHFFPPPGGPHFFQAGLMLQREAAKRGWWSQHGGEGEMQSVVGCPLLLLPIGEMMRMRRGGSENGKERNQKRRRRRHEPASRKETESQEVVPPEKEAASSSKDASPFTPSNAEENPKRLSQKGLPPVFSTFGWTREGTGEEGGKASWYDAGWRVRLGKGKEEHVQEIPKGPEGAVVAEEKKEAGWWWWWWRKAMKKGKEHSEDEPLLCVRRDVGISHLLLSQVSMYGVYSLPLPTFGAPASSRDGRTSAGGGGVGASVPSPSAPFTSSFLSPLLQRVYLARLPLGNEYRFGSYRTVEAGLEKWVQQWLSRVSPLSCRPTSETSSTVLGEGEEARGWTRTWKLQKFIPPSPDPAGLNGAWTTVVEKEEDEEEESSKEDVETPEEEEEEEEDGWRASTILEYFYRHYFDPRILSQEVSASSFSSSSPPPSSGSSMGWDAPGGRGATSQWRLGTLYFLTWHEKKSTSPASLPSSPARSQSLPMASSMRKGWSGGKQRWLKSLLPWNTEATKEPQAATRKSQEEEEEEEEEEESGISMVLRLFPPTLSRKEALVLLAPLDLTEGTPMGFPFSRPSSRSSLCPASVSSWGSERGTVQSMWTWEALFYLLHFLCECRVEFPRESLWSTLPVAMERAREAWDRHHPCPPRRRLGSGGGDPASGTTGTKESTQDTAPLPGASLDVHQEGRRREPAASMWGGAPLVYRQQELILGIRHAGYLIGAAEVVETKKETEKEEEEEEMRVVVVPTPSSCMTTRGSLTVYGTFPLPNCTTTPLHGGGEGGRRGTVAVSVVCTLLQEPRPPREYLEFLLSEFELELQMGSSARCPGSPSRPPLAPPPPPGQGGASTASHQASATLSLHVEPITDAWWRRAGGWGVGSSSTAGRGGGGGTWGASLGFGRGGGGDGTSGGPGRSATRRGGGGGGGEEAPAGMWVRVVDPLASMAKAQTTSHEEEVGRTEAKSGEGVCEGSTATTTPSAAASSMGSSMEGSSSSFRTVWGKEKLILARESGLGVLLVVQVLLPVVPTTPLPLSSSSSSSPSWNGVGVEEAKALREAVLEWVVRDIVMIRCAPPPSSTAG